jgi:hypothetical protein
MASRGKQIKRTFNNLKLTILYGFVTILVLRSTIGIGNLTSSPDADGDTRKIAEETNRILAEIRSDDEPSDPNGSKGTCSGPVFSLLGEEGTEGGKRGRRKALEER